MVHSMRYPLKISYKSGTTSYIGHEISLRQSLSEIAVNPDTNLAYVTNGGNDSVSVINRRSTK